jgi:hypothetical protein
VPADVLELAITDAVVGFNPYAHGSSPFAARSQPKLTRSWIGFAQLRRAAVAPVRAGVTVERNKHS